MKIRSAILSGSIVWILVLIVFTLLSFIPGIKDSEIQQEFLIGILIIPMSLFGAALYYRNVSNVNGFKLGLVMVSTALLLDAFITVPVVEIPYNASSYRTFFTNPLLWILVLENVIVVYLYWRLKVKR
ncbi:MAG TPA: DUF5367 family protein [Chryseolinea sp.]|nr:DUF5367 family protein [Chryseolinea sp.]HPH46992.1 DUF5367 family protein [Chryseolinea sp.]HPM31196.1 DUF5367 family protein [Chryseolinea sp.]